MDAEDLPAPKEVEALREDQGRPIPVHRAPAPGPLAGVLQPLRGSWVAREPRIAEVRTSLVTSKEGLLVPSSWSTPDTLAASLWSWHETFPEITAMYEIGQSNQGRSIYALRIGGGAGSELDFNEPAVLLDGAIHGHEFLATDYALDAIRMLVGDPDLREGLDWWVVPLANPDGRHRALFADDSEARGRKNGADTDGVGGFDPLVDGVDLNRNWPFRWGASGGRASSGDPKSTYYRGSAPGSEPETQALLTLAERFRFVAGLSYHTCGRLVLSPYTVQGARNPAPDVAWSLAEALAKASPQGFRAARQMYAVEGTSQDDLFHRFGMLSYIVEGSHQNPPDLASRKLSVEGVRPMLSVLAGRLQEGPGVRGHTFGPDGRPVGMRVTIAEIATFEGEEWTSRPLDGRFDRLLPGPGTWTLVAWPDEGPPIRQRVRVEKGWADVDLWAEAPSSAADALPSGDP